jgi:membrane dipeptidase
VIRARRGVIVRPLGPLRFAAAITLVAALSVARPPMESSPAVAVVDLSEDLIPHTMTGPPSLASRNGQASLVHLRQGNVSGVVLTLHEARRGAPLDISAETAYLDLERRLPQQTAFHAPGCRSGGGRIVTWLALDGASELARDPSRIGLWIARGVRIFGIVATTDNELGTSFTDPPPGPVVGLSDRGKDVVRRIYEQGAVVDVSSASAPTRDDVFAVARTLHAPVVALSSNARALADDPRNLTDPELREIAESGGVVGVSFEQMRVVRGRTATLHDLVRQIAYMVRVAGVEHVALASSYENTRPLDGLETAAEFPVLGRALLASGMERADVERIFRGNAVRLLCPSTR